jgi:cyclopropane-fatty-acyl-phospholipid synthase
MLNSTRLVTDLLAEADVQVGGDRPWDIRVADERLFSEVLRKRNLALGEGYMRGWWECDRIDEFICRILRSGLERRVRGGPLLALGTLPARICNLQTRARAGIVAERHYDLGNDLFQGFLDPYLQYSCGCFQGTGDLDRAQVNKMRMLCDKLELRPEHRLLDIGCGWGGLARFAAETYGCEVVGVNISRQQIGFAREFCEGLPVEIRQCDYRSLNEPFDRVVSVGMFEHVGCRNYGTFMDVVARCLKPDGIFVLHTIGSNVTSRECDPWITRYIFPNGCLPSIVQIARVAEKWFSMEDWHNLGPHYDPTLMSWLHNFRSAWNGLKDRYDATFKRMWEYYLQSCAGAFRARDLQLWQVVFTHVGAEQPVRRV